MRSVIAATVLLICARGLAANLVPNPSAEAGTDAPDSWRAAPLARGFWQDGEAKFGSRCLGLDATDGPAFWRTPAVPANAVQGYRLSGWVKAEGGSGWLQVRFLGEHEHLDASATTPPVRGNSWTYVAVEIQTSNIHAANRAYVLCHAAEGRCFFDGVRLTLLDRNILPNPELSPLLVDDKPDPSGRPAGWHALPESDTRPVAVSEVEPGKLRGLRLGGGNPTGVASYIVDLPPQTQACRLRALALPPVKVTYVISWFGQHGWMGDEPLGVHASDGGLTEYYVTAYAPRGANRARAAFFLEEGEWAVIAPLSLSAETKPEPPRCQVLANQVGYEPDARKTAIVATSHFPAGLEDARFAVLNGRGRSVFTGRLVPLGRVHEGRADDWGSYYWLADFSPLTKTGRFRIEARIGNQVAASHPFRIGSSLLLAETAELAYRFLYYQRCGAEVPGWHGPCHLDDARLPDETHLNLAGGWHDAGDYNKWMYPEGPPLVLYGLASAYAAHRNFFDAMDRDGNGRADLLDEILWGADWLMRMRNPKTGGLFGSITTGWGHWGLAERETDNIPGNADDRPVREEEPSAALAAAALAKAGRCASDGDAFTRAAIELEAYARKKEGKSPDRLLACLAIWEATAQREYLDEARACAGELVKTRPASRQGRALAALALFLATVGKEDGEQEYRQAIEHSLAWLSAMQSQPFAVAAGRAGSPADMEDEPRLRGMGSHMALTSNAWAALACARALGSVAAAQAAFNELDWLFGLNPLDLCMLEGVGSFNSPRYHHRYFDHPQHRDGAVPGAIPNGIARPNRQPSLDMPFFDWVHRHAMTAEPWIPYNGYYLCALSLMDTGT